MLFVLDFRVRATSTLTISVVGLRPIVWLCWVWVDSVVRVVV